MKNEEKQRVWMGVRVLLMATLVGVCCGGVVGLTLGGVTAVLAQLVEGITAVALGAAGFGGLIGGVVGFCAGCMMVLDGLG